MTAKRYNIQTFGCQMNVSDSERLAGMLEGEGYAEASSAEDADVILINTCSVREKAAHKLYSELGRLRHLKERADGGPTIAVAGCVAQQERERVLRRAPHVDLVLGPRSLSDFPELLRAARTQSTPVTAFGYRGSSQESFVGARRPASVRAFVTVMEGCDRFCSFCIVPHTRGREWSRPLPDIEAEVRGLIARGFREVTLLGQSVLAYGKRDGLEARFPDVLRAVGTVPGLDRVRFATSHPVDVDAPLAASMAALPAVCEHIHLPFQSGSDRILAHMNRGHTAAEYLQKIALLRAAVPNLGITADVIVGYPEESEEDFQATLDLIAEVRFDGLFSFIYSPRPRTPAEKLDELPREIGATRLQRLMDLQREISRAAYQRRIGRHLEVLVEGPSKKAAERLTGRARDNKVVNFAGPDELTGQLVAVEITGATPYSLSGRAAGRPEVPAASR
ncbi:MAG: tRNA (N6-isopentenyl adenosine(37)-C2)-methylthiotransferase MiaB [Candidatus Schekmanbacteria bacterium]|nr:tRNA (N6-isopentenyl adenosine(37)-C2)-methylthiotransferase MiaB [Candidatus Schekmanbacteria bacterium]